MTVFRGEGGPLEDRHRRRTAAWRKGHREGGLTDSAALRLLLVLMVIVVAAAMCAGGKW